MCAAGQCLSHPVPLPPIPASLSSSAIVELTFAALASVAAALLVIVAAVRAAGYALELWRRRASRAATRRHTSIALVDALAPFYASDNSDAVSGPLVWSGLNVRLHDDRALGYLLFGGWGSVARGSIHGVVGESGSGKTTLLHVLGGTRSKLGSRGLIDGSVSGPTAARIKLVLQFPALLPHFTVAETLSFAIDAHAPFWYAYAERNLLLGALLDALALRRVADARIGDPAAVVHRGLSSGERKRLSLALGLIRAPHFLLADEPTTGLDALTAASVMSLLRTLADELNIGVLVTLHAPSRAVLNTLDTLTHLHRGYVVYSGSPAVVDLEGSLIALARASPDAAADLARATEVRRRTASDRLGARHGSRLVSYPLSGRTSPSRAHVRVGPVAQAIGWVEDMIRVLRRLALAAWRDPLLLRAQYVLTLGAALLLGGVFWDLPLNLIGAWNRIGLLFFSASLFSGLATVVLHLLSGWLPVVVREVRSGLYSRTAFFVAFAIFDIVPFRVIPALLFGSITYWMAGLQEEPAKFLTFELYVVLVAGASSGMFLALGALLHRTPLLLGMAGALVHLGFMLFGGFLLNVQNVQPAIAWLLDVSPVRYAFQALMFNELNGIAFNFDPKAGNFPQSTLDASILIRQFGSGDGGTWLPAYALAGLWASGIAVALVVLLTAALR
ncbi:uncharacterized protein AMSG_04673 [Thecamonas trahens ATCC 50062]|uniref:ABC transporter domain-containing protein n=1 Tax=Thecamonas trahens ATCC 50062 TaxID=461836 RepID=A0A0L0DC94_THETB|nr:hypothetical protein AMSG_04673 [Thecamonas trahens ATCC 50062]KNC48928.1 hypothetical protein AMSG_04673 [Thecamonas trahens ATCC 50062]|eukprot:XP_013758345.1 hypothetical protein AMSG_04673 [Thecamonas trahens ATCC 50062]